MVTIFLELIQIVENDELFKNCSFAKNTIQTACKVLLSRLKSNSLNTGDYIEEKLYKCYSQFNASVAHSY